MTPRVRALRRPAIVGTTLGGATRFRGQSATTFRCRTIRRRRTVVLSSFGVSWWKIPGPYNKRPFLSISTWQLSSD